MTFREAVVGTPMVVDVTAAAAAAAAAAGEGSATLPLCVPRAVRLWGALAKLRTPDVHGVHLASSVDAGELVRGRVACPARPETVMPIRLGVGKG